MSPRQLGLIALGLGALLLLWGAAALVRGGGIASGRSERFALPAITVDKVDTVWIARRADTTLLVKRDSAHWTANGHPTAAGPVRDLLNALSDSSRRSELIATKASSHRRMGVDSSGTHVRVAGPTGRLADFILGQRSADLDGGYMRMASDSAVWLVRGGLASTLERGPDEWRDRGIGGAARDSIARIDVKRGARSYSLRRTGIKWTLGGGAPTDSTAVGELLAALEHVEASGFASAAQADSARFNPADRSVRALRKDGSPLLALVFDSMPAGFWARSDTGKVVYRLETWATDRLTPAESALRPQKKK
jgi:hypothetical protein